MLPNYKKPGVCWLVSLSIGIFLKRSKDWVKPKRILPLYIGIFLSRRRKLLKIPGPTGSVPTAIHTMTAVERRAASAELPSQKVEKTTWNTR